MLNANEANRRSNERMGTDLMMALLHEVEQAILARCEKGCKCAIWETALPNNPKYEIMAELRGLGYDVDAAPSGIFIRW